NLSLSMLRLLSEQSAGPFWFKPSCGTPTIRENVLKYPISSETFAQELTALSKMIPLSAVGGCCGASPEHMRALAKSLAGAGEQVTQ
ncbi:MAG: homocysteine S-methyltransferase family protein, partial [candidate division Zixibacteria bacterium]|nr:homocysteine S-methyltransferase family protein [candidate division Zixibacteria bacterium]